jgi:hypothetical protein
MCSPAHGWNDDSRHGTCEKSVVIDPQTDVAQGKFPGPQCAFEMSMFNVSCNSH